MSNNQVDSIGFRKENYPNVLDVANELAELEQRKPHDSIRLLILEAGRAKISQLKSQVTQINNESQEQNGQKLQNL